MSICTHTEPHRTTPQQTKHPHLTTRCSTAESIFSELLKDFKVFKLKICTHREQTGSAGT
jgi:hypothetical protein